MKNALLIILSALFLMTVTMMALAGDNKGDKNVPPAAKELKVESAERLYPIAPGVWYPGDGPLPDKPIRYYRVRCWPGCHSGSSHGMYPDEELDYNPIFPTSTLDKCLDSHQKE